MSQPPTPRGPLGQLLDQAKDDSGWEWRDVERESGIAVTTIQAWISGRTAEPPLRGLLHLAKTMGIDPQAVMDRALEGYVPPLKERSMSGEGVELVPEVARSAVGDEVAVLGDARRGGRRQKPKRRGPTSRPGS